MENLFKILLNLGSVEEILSLKALAVKKRSKSRFWEVWIMRKHWSDVASINNNSSLILILLIHTFKELNNLFTPRVLIPLLSRVLIYVSNKISYF